MVDDKEKKKEKESKYEERKAIVTIFEGVRFGAVLPEVETTTKGKVSVRDLGAGGEKAVKKAVQAFIVSDPRLPTGGPIPHSVWEDYWREFMKNLPRYVEHISTTVTNASGVVIKPSDVDLKATFTVDAVLVKKEEEKNYDSS